MSEENGNDKQKLQVDVKVDESEELQRLKEEKEDLEAKLQLIAEKAFEGKKRELGCLDAEIDTPEKLEAWRLGKEGSKSHSGASGKALLQNEPSVSRETSVKEYDSYEDMMQDLNVRAHSSNAEVQAEAQTILNQLFSKTAKKPMKMEIDLLKRQRKAWNKISEQRDKAERGEKED